MQGFILDLRRVREEDLIVTIITKDEIRDYYRFFGARHSILQL
ncbi:MAG: recombination protein RecO, partial [Epsilonproteobacteria bacterium]|nr:recombination protein RecO [Campylobacterota bacterium]